MPRAAYRAETLVEGVDATSRVCWGVVGTTGIGGLSNNISTESLVSEGHVNSRHLLWEQWDVRHEHWVRRVGMMGSPCGLQVQKIPCGTLKDAKSIRTN